VSQHIDTTVYKGPDQLLAMILCRKDSQDNRILKPVDASVPLEHFTVTHPDPQVIEHVILETFQVFPGSAQPQPLAQTTSTGLTGPIGPHDKVVRLLNLLGKHRWNDYKYWIDIGIALKNVGLSQFNDPDRYKGTWIAMSRISPKFDPNTDPGRWDGFCSRAVPLRLTLRSVEAWAKQDDPFGHAQYRAANVPQFVYDNFMNGDNGLAKIAGELLQDVLKISNKNYYHYDTDRNLWLLKPPEDLKLLVSDVVASALRDLDLALRTEEECIVANTAMEPDARSAARDAVAKRRGILAKQLAVATSSAGMWALTSNPSCYWRDDPFEQEFDSIPYLVGVSNGVVDLRTGELRERVPADKVYQIVECDYDPNADTSFMHAVVKEIMADDEEMAGYLQKLLGYGITGEVCEEIFVVWTSGGRSGKGLLTQTLAGLLGQPMYQEMSPVVICDRQTSNLDAERGKLLGVRLAVFNELEPGDKLRTDQVKLLSGGDGIPARPLYKNPITIKPRHLCILATNHMPCLGGNDIDTAMIERLQCVNFPVTFCDLDGAPATPTRRQIDRDLKAKLLSDEHRPGVLRWLVEGAVAWYATKDIKRNAPLKVREFSQQYFSDQDVLAAFIHDHCNLDPEARIGTTVFYDVFKQLVDRKVFPNAQNLVAAMKQRGFQKKYMSWNSGKVQCFLGITIKSESINSLPYNVSL